jgi:F-box/leucine-rich repeat protein 7
MIEPSISREDPAIYRPIASVTNTHVIEPSSVCSTTSDQDPTLLPATAATAATALKTVETRRRRGSVAIWSDPNLIALANKALKPTRAEPEETKLKTDYSSRPSFPGDGRLVTINEEILGLIVDYMDFATVLQFSTLSKKCRDFLQHNDKILHSVDLSHLNKRVTDSTAEKIVALVGNRVKRLNLSQCFYITDEGFKTLIENMPSIESMDLNSCWLLTDKSLSFLGAACPRLVKLDLSNCRKITDSGIFRLLDEKSSRGYPELTDLSLSYCKKLSDMTMSHLAEFCSKTLASLNIQRCTRITDQGFVKWADTDFPNLKTLNLTDCSFLTDQAISHLVAAAPNLHSLSLSFCCALSDSAIEGLISLAELQELDASFCGAAVSDCSIRALLKSNFAESMNSLNLRGCVRITDICVKTILELGQLGMLNISQCPGISVAAKETIKVSGHVQHLVA